MRVYVHGNCQAPAIASLIAGQFPNWRVDSYEVFTQTITDQIDAYHDIVAQADIIISQPVHDGYRDRQDLSLSWVRSAAKLGAALVVVPSLFFDGQLVGWRSVAIPGYGMPYQDMLVLHCAAMGMAADRITTIVLDQELYPDSFISSEIKLSIEEMRRREAGDGIDIQFSPFLERYGYRAPLFHVINHPCRPSLAYVANETLAHLGYPATVPFAGPECLRYPHVPLTACVRRFLRARAGGPSEWEIDDGERYHLPTKALLTPAEYCMRVVNHLRPHRREELLQQLQDGHVRPFLERLADKVPGIPGIGMWRAARRPTL